MGLPITIHSHAGAVNAACTVPDTSASDMEAVGLAASIITIAELGKKLNNAVASLVGNVCMS